MPTAHAPTIGGFTATGLEPARPAFVITAKMERPDRMRKLPADASVADHVAERERWKNEGPWVPACGGTEVPFTARSGARLLYCWQPRSGRHAYMDMGTDMVLTDEEAAHVMGR